MSRFSSWLTVLGLAWVASSGLADDGMHTFDGAHSLENIEATFVYFVPNDRTPLPDWRERVDYFARRVKAFHAREFGGQSSLKVVVHPEPFRSAKSSKEVRGDDPNETYDHTMTETRQTLKWPAGPRKAFPILLVLSDINWRELDDFRRVRVVDGKEEHEGNIGAGGRHFPGAESGGSRASYWSREGFGLGLVSADGWRVPYCGSDCVAFHEGLGHTIGLPHPEPIDSSVMGVAQYEGWINETSVNEGQKKALGWKPKEGEPKGPESLFTAFTALPSPDVPKAGQPVALRLRWPKGAKVKSLRVRYQTELTGPWVDAKVTLDPSAKPPARLQFAPFEKATPVSYRVDAALEDGQVVELWGYFQVK